ncbi:MAG: pitrilysin family protein [Steroidobacteraceae bacterium]
MSARLLLRSLTLSLLLCFAAVPSLVFAAATVQIPKYERIALANGAVLLLMERHDVPLIAFSADLRGGAMTDPVTASGSASLLANLLEKGAGSRDAFAFADAIAAVGGTIAASADTESINVSGSFLNKDRALMIELLADMLQRPRLAREEFDSLRSRQIDFLRAAKDSDLGSLTPIYGAAAVFGEHVYGKSPIGSEAGLAAITHEQLTRYYRDQLGADRLILTIVGDFKTADLKPLVTKAFAGWRKAEQPFSRPAPPTKVTGRRVLLVDAPTSVQSYFWAGNVGVSRAFPQRAPLDVVNTLFGGRFTSLLNSELRIRTGLSYGASSRFDRMLEPGAWELVSFTKTASTIEAIDLALDVVGRLHADIIDATMLDSSKAYVQGQFPLALETSAQWASALGDLEFYGLDRGYIDQRLNALAAVTLEDARKIVQSQFPTADNLTLVVIGNAAAIREGLRKFGPVTEMKLSDPSFAPQGK